MCSILSFLLVSTATTRPQNSPQMLQIETEESLPGFNLNLQHLGPQKPSYCYRSRQTSGTGVSRQKRRRYRASPRLPLAGVAGLFAALPPRWGCVDRRIVLLTACQLIWEAL